MAGIALAWRLAGCPEGPCAACNFVGLVPVALVGPPVECRHGWLVGIPKDGSACFSWGMVREAVRLSGVDGIPHDYDYPADYEGLLACRKCGHLLNSGEVSFCPDPE